MKDMVETKTALKIMTQPKTLPGDKPRKPSYHSGAKRSISRMDDLSFDPIKELVLKYRKLEDELVYQEDVRANKIVPLTAEGKIRRYNEETHMAIYEKLINTSEKLLRYYYGRVPETTIVEEKKVSPLIVNLTRAGDVYQIGKDLEEFEFIED